MAKTIDALNERLWALAKKRDEESIPALRRAIQDHEAAKKGGDARGLLASNEAITRASADVLDVCAALGDWEDEFRDVFIAEFGAADQDARLALKPIREEIATLRPRLAELESQEAAELARIQPAVDRIGAIKTSRERQIADQRFHNKNAMDLVVIAKKALV